MEILYLSKFSEHNWFSQSSAVLNYDICDVFYIYFCWPISSLYYMMLKPISVVFSFNTFAGYAMAVVYAKKCIWDDVMLSPARQTPSRVRLLWLSELQWNKLNVLNLYISFCVPAIEKVLLIIQIVFAQWVFFIFHVHTCFCRKFVPSNIDLHKKKIFLWWSVARTFYLSSTMLLRGSGECDGVIVIVSSFICHPACSSLT